MKDESLLQQSPFVLDIMQNMEDISLCAFSVIPIHNCLLNVLTLLLIDRSKPCPVRRLEAFQLRQIQPLDRQPSSTSEPVVASRCWLSVDRLSSRGKAGKRALETPPKPTDWPVLGEQYLCKSATYPNVAEKRRLFNRRQRSYGQKTASRIRFNVERTVRTTWAASVPKIHTSLFKERTRGRRAPAPAVRLSRVVARHTNFPLKGGWPAAGVFWAPWLLRRSLTRSLYPVPREESTL